MPSPSLSAGFAAADITPPLGSRLYGYPNPDRTADELWDPLYARALVWEQDGLVAGWVVLDWCMVEEAEVAAIREAVAAAIGMTPAHLTVGAIQTHSGPATQSAAGWGDRDQVYLDSVRPRIVETVAQAYAQRQPVRVGVGTTYSEVGVNRREIREDHTIALGVNPWGPFDPTMTVLRFEGADGPVATVVHYGAHPTAQGAVRAVSRDWPGVLVDRLEKVTGGPAMFINGAVGDVGPRVNLNGTTGDGLEASREVGYRAAGDATRAWRQISDLREVALSVLVEDLLLPYAPLPPLDEALRQLNAAEPQRDRWGAGRCEWCYWQSVVEAHQRPLPPGRTYTQTVTRLGPVALVPLPGEPFAEILLRLRHRSPFEHTLCASTTNGAMGYFVTREARARGGYEVWVAKAFGAYLPAENLDDVLVAENLRLLRQASESHTG